eukprot:1156595-Pelagomonas_calceolata.AAC.1
MATQMTVLLLGGFEVVLGPGVLSLTSHAGIAGNECADAIAKYQANQANSSVADTGIPGAGPGENPFTHFFWLAKEEERELSAGTSFSFLFSFLLPARGCAIHSSCVQS